jgi:hypothetical protein
MHREYYYCWRSMVIVGAYAGGYRNVQEVILDSFWYASPHIQTPLHLSKLRDTPM